MENQAGVDATVKLIRMLIKHQVPAEQIAVIDMYKNDRNTIIAIPAQLRPP